MSFAYTKLFASITESTVWSEPLAVRVVWITMLAMADRYGRVWGAVPGLARRANVTLKDCQAALKRFQSKDEHSRTPDHDGRRIEAIDGGWKLLNYEKYRALQDQEAAKAKEADRSKRYRDRQAHLFHGEQSRSVTLNHAESRSDTVRHPIAEAEAVKEEKKTPVGVVEQDITIWRVGVGLLTKTGQTERSARAFLGKFAKGRESRLAEVIGYLSANPKVEPKAYIAAAMKDGGHAGTLGAAEVD